MQTNTQRIKTLAACLRFLGALDMLALGAVVMPFSWMNGIAIAVGLDPLPSHAIVGYLARSASVMYALHGITVFFISFDVVRYWQLIRLLATVAVLHGVVMFGIDSFQRLPVWWQLMEGPLFAATGVFVLCLQGAERPE
jgi:hypothetical protein